jgi:hypothetical protein
MKRERIVSFRGKAVFMRPRGSLESSRVSSRRMTLKTTKRLGRPCKERADSHRIRQPAARVDRMGTGLINANSILLEICSSSPFLPSSQRPIQIERSRHQRQVTECLGCVTQLFARLSDFLREHAKMIAKAQHVFEHGDRLKEIFAFVRTGLHRHVVSVIN